MLAATFFLLWQLSRVAPPYRRQGRVLIVASVIPFLGERRLDLDPPANRGPVVDPTPFLFLITAFVLVWGFFRLRLLNLVPVARSLVLEQMADGVLVLDLFGRVVDANPAASRLLGREKFPHGRPPAAPTCCPVLEPMLARPGSRTAPADETEVLIRRADVAGRPHGRRCRSPTCATPPAACPRGWPCSTTSPSTAAPSASCASCWRSRPRWPRRCSRGCGRRQLPDVDGVRLAARSVPAQARPASAATSTTCTRPGPGRSAFVLGDVSGKGVHAAIVTSMARYTVRTLSAQGWRPRQVLEQLNEALLRRRTTRSGSARWSTGTSSGTCPRRTGRAASG